MQLEDFVEDERYEYSMLSVAAGYGRKPGGNFERGIVIAPKPNPTAIMIKMNLSKALYPDMYDEEKDYFYYIGDGLPEKGHQELKYGNKIMTENQELPVLLFLRYKDEKKGDPWWFKGRWRITGVERDFISDAKIPDGSRQRVFRFKLSKADTIPDERLIFEEKSSFGTYLSESSYIRASPEILRVIEPKHKKLANQFARWLKTEGFKNITLENNQIDLTFEHQDTQFMSELKVVYSLSTTKSIREAMGQILEYNYYDSRIPYDQWLVVIDSKPKENDLQYVRRLEKEIHIPVILGWKLEKEFTFTKSLL